MLEKIDHIGIAVKNADASIAIFNALLNQIPIKEERVESENVRTVFYKSGDSKIELLEALSEESAIAKFIEKRGEGVHHIAFAVDDIYAEITRLKNEGFVFTRDEPFVGADNKLVIFIHPKSSNSVLIELCQEIK